MLGFTEKKLHNQVIRLAVATALGFFMLRGSSTAVFIWAALSVIATIYGFAWALKVSQTNPTSAVVSGTFGALALAQAMYLVLSRSMRAHMGSA